MDILMQKESMIGSARAMTVSNLESWKASMSLGEPELQPQQCLENSVVPDGKSHGEYDKRNRRKFSRYLCCPSSASFQK